MQDQVLTEEAKRMFESLIPQGKISRPEEIAAAALFLASCECMQRRIACGIHAVTGNTLIEATDPVMKVDPPSLNSGNAV